MWGVGIFESQGIPPCTIQKSDSSSQRWRRLPPPFPWHRLNETALNACARAFASSLATPGSTAPSFKVAYRGNLYTGSMLEFYSREFTFDLNAKDPKTGLAIARASCSTDSSGAVIALSSLPVASRTLTAQD